MSPKSFLASVTVLAVVLVACLTVNVYFYPSEQVDQTAKDIIDDIRGSGAAPEDQKEKPDEGHGGAGTGGWELVGVAYAAGQETSVSSAAIDSLKQRLKQRSPTLAKYFDAGAIGEGRDGLVVVRDAAAVPMKDRAKLNGLVKDENDDRMALYKEVAKELKVKDKDLPQVQRSFAEQWRETSRKGWWVQDDQGGWYKF
jgi:uncharacterized protein YdbL (DUF1318 family)